MLESTIMSNPLRDMHHSGANTFLSSVGKSCKQVLAYKHDVDDWRGLIL